MTISRGMSLLLLVLARGSILSNSRDTGRIQAGARAAPMLTLGLSAFPVQLRLRCESDRIGGRQSGIVLVNENPIESPAAGSRRRQRPPGRAAYICIGLMSWK